MWSLRARMLSRSAGGVRTPLRRRTNVCPADRYSGREQVQATRHGPARAVGETGGRARETTTVTGRVRPPKPEPGPPLARGVVPPVSRSMIAFTFPGQGSQKPGIGAPWRDHPSWEVVNEASAACGRDVATLLLEADADELKADPQRQLATFVASLVVLDAVERVGVEPGAVAGHSLGEYTALVGVRGPVVRGRLSASSPSGAKPCRRPPRSTRARWPPCSAWTTTTSRWPAPRVDGDVWVANYNGPGQVVVAGNPDALVQLAARRQGARGQAGDGAARERGVPHAVHGAGARPPAQGARRGRHPRRREPRGRQRRRAGRTPTAASGRACSPPSCAARCVGASPSTRSTTSA